jgi:hypothetical protein
MENIEIVKLIQRKGLKANLPILDEGELGFSTDTGEVFIGSSTGNILFAKSSDLDSVNEQLADMVRSVNGTLPDDNGNVTLLTGDGGSSIVTRDVTVGEIFTLNGASTIYGQIVLSKTTTTIIEGGSDTFTVHLDKQPTNSQVVSLTTNNPDVTLNPASLTFTTLNYSTPKTVTISVTEDDLDYSNELATISLTSPNVVNKSLIVNITDNDVAPAPVSVTGIEVTPPLHTLNEGETLQLVATIQPTDATNKEVTYTTSNANVTVTSSGLVIPKIVGDCTITVTTVDGGFTDTSVITVASVAEQPNYIEANLDVMYDFTKYADGYNGEVLDEVNNVPAIVSGLGTPETGRNGFIGGTLMLNGHKSGAGFNTEFSIPTRESFTSYPFTLEFYGTLRRPYNLYTANGTLEYVPDLINDQIIMSTRSGGTGGNGYLFRYSDDMSVDVIGSLNSPSVTFPSGYNINQPKDIHMVFVIESNRQRVYFDNVLVSDTAGAGTNLSGSTRQLQILKQPVTLGANMKLLRVYNSALTEQEVDTNYNGLKGVGI